MKKIEQTLSRLNLFFTDVPDLVIVHKKKIWIFFILLTLFLFYGTRYFEINMSMEAYFKKDDPVRIAFDRLKEKFEGTASIYIIYRSKDKDIFSPRSLKTVSQIVSDIKNFSYNLPPGKNSPLDHVVDVHAITNASYMEVKKDTLLSRQFVGKNFPKTDAQIKQLKKDALNHHDYPLRYLSLDFQYGAIIIRTDFGSIRTDEQKFQNSDTNTQPKTGFDDDEVEITDTVITKSQNRENFKKGPPEFLETSITEYADFMHALREILNKSEYSKYIEYYPVGEAVTMEFLQDQILPELQNMSLWLIFVIALLFLALFKSFSAALWPISIVVITTIWVIGLAGWLDVTMTTLVYLIIYLLLVVGIGDAVHILSGYLFFRNKNITHRQTLRSVFKKSGLACFLTSITTSIGMLSLTFVPIIPIQNMGIFSAIGVMGAFALTIFLLPLMIDLWKPYSKKRAQQTLQAGGKTDLVQKFLLLIEPICYKYPKRIVTIIVILGIILTYGALKIRVDSSLIEILPKDNRVRKDFYMADTHMGGTQYLDILIQSQTPDALKDPLVLNTMEDIQNYLAGTYTKWVKKTFSLVNVTKETYQILNEGKKSFYTIPQDKTVLEQTLFLFNNANPKDRRRLVTDDYSTGRITVNLKTAGSKDMEIILTDAQSHIDGLMLSVKEKYPKLQIILTGSLSLGTKLVNIISWSQIRSFGIAFIVISLIFFFTFGSAKIGIIAIIPNMLPIITIFGIMGYFDIPLDADTLLTAPIVIGIVVDDTIHFITHFRAEMLTHNNIKTAIINTIHEAGQAIIFTSLVLSGAFLHMLLLTHQGLMHFGLLSTTGIMTALFCDLFMLPSLFILFNVQFKKIDSKKCMAIECYPNA